MKEAVLVIDDEKGIRLTFETFLSDAGYDVQLAKNCEEALVCLREREFGLIFLDIILEERSGIDLLREIKQKHPAWPVVLITGYPSLETAAEAVRLGAFDYISKPVGQEMLLRVTRQALTHKALVEEKERYRANLDGLFRSVAEGIVMVDKDLVVLDINDAARDICSFGGDVVGKVFSSLHTQCERACARALEDAIRCEKPASVKRLSCFHSGGNQRVVAVTVSPLRDREGKVYGGIVVVRDETRLDTLERDLGKRTSFQSIVGKCPQMQRIYSLIEALADTPTTVLITGETGTGKELIAEAIHRSGSRSGKPFVKVNCSALSENLLESELFGHVKGAFTGAIGNKAGRFEIADGGSILLDEIGDISRQMQLKLLRVLQEREFERVGSTSPITVDVRVLAATNQDLTRKVKDGAFREDLYYRLKVVELSVPPLRERREDIPLLVDHLVTKCNERLNKGVLGVTDDVESLFSLYAWPGNVRELEHVIEHGVLLSPRPLITVEDLPQELRAVSKSAPARPAAETDNLPEMILSALEKTGWNKALAARLLDMGRTTLYRKIKDYGIKADSPFKRKS
jgi:PAS domain S-box-containing protein